MLLLTAGLSGCIDDIKDTDGDGYNDDVDKFIHDPNEWEDFDMDGVGDNSDAFKYNPFEWKDSDNDSYGDNSDAYKYDPNQWNEKRAMFGQVQKIISQRKEVMIKEVIKSGINRMKEEYENLKMKLTEPGLTREDKENIQSKIYFLFIEINNLEYYLTHTPRRPGMSKKAWMQLKKAREESLRDFTLYRKSIEKSEIEKHIIAKNNTYLIINALDESNDTCFQSLSYLLSHSDNNSTQNILNIMIECFNSNSETVEYKDIIQTTYENLDDEYKLEYNRLFLDI